MLFYKIRVQKGVKVMKFSEFIYKRIDLEETKKKIQEITEKLKHAQSVEEQVQAIYEMNDVKKEIALSCIFVIRLIQKMNFTQRKENTMIILDQCWKRRCRSITKYC